MGILGIETVTYVVDDLETCNRFFSDLGLALQSADDTTATFTTLAGQRVIVTTEPGPRLPAAVQDGPTLREIVWGTETDEDLQRLVAAVGTDREVGMDADGVFHTVDETGFGVGLTLSTLGSPQVRGVAPSNRWGSVGRWNEPVLSVGKVRPTRICHVALDIPRAGREKAAAFYIDRLGFIPTDIVDPVGVFMRCPGDDDHHNFLLCHRPDSAGVNHVSYEVPAFDDVLEGGNRMLDAGWTETRRLGRHTVGSNVFRFFHAPCGGRVELAADMDRVDDNYGPNHHETAPPHHVWTLRMNRESAGNADR